MRQNKLRTVSTVAAASLPMGKHVQAERHEGVWQQAAYFDKTCIGYFDTANEAREALDDLVYQMLTRQPATA